MINIFSYCWSNLSVASAEPETCSSKVHKAKGFSDDLTVISNNKVDSHQQSFNLACVYPFIIMVIELCPLHSSQCLMVIL